MMLVEQILLISSKIVPVVLAVVLLYFLAEDRKKLLLYIISVLCVALFTYGLKYTVDAPRPDDAAWDKNTARFPSGHTSLVFVPFLFIGLWKYRFPYLGYSALVAYSRLYFNLHIPVDVIAGAAIGIVVPFIVFRYKERILGTTEKFLERF